MFGSLGGGELILILVLALLLFGPRRLPGIGRTLGKAVQEFRGAANDFRRGIEREVHMEELRAARDGVAEVGRELKSDLRQVARDTRAGADSGGEARSGAATGAATDDATDDATEAGTDEEADAARPAS